MMSKEYKLFNGILWIGDPHLSSKAIGRRNDDYTLSVLNKLSESAIICNTRNLLPVIAGDLFHVADENHLKTLNRLIRVLKQFDEIPRCLEGNHDKKNFTTGDEDALTLIVEAGVLKLYDKFELAETITINDKIINLWGCPHGTDLPKKLPENVGETNVLFTHHDLAFGSAYPGALPLYEIKGCSMVLNGHMHDRKESVKKGATLWHNKGNIEPVSVDLINHVPAVWEWDGNQEFELTEHTLTHNRDVFDLTGIKIKAADSADSVNALIGGSYEGGKVEVEVEESEFVKALVSDQSLDANKTSDAEIIISDLTEILELMNASEGTRTLMTTLASTLSNPS